MYSHAYSYIVTMNAFPSHPFDKEHNKSILVEKYDNLESKFRERSMQAQLVLKDIFQESELKSPS